MRPRDGFHPTRLGRGPTSPGGLGGCAEIRLDFREQLDSPRLESGRAISRWSGPANDNDRAAGWLEGQRGRTSRRAAPGRTRAFQAHRLLIHGVSVPHRGVWSALACLLYETVFFRQVASAGAPAGGGQGPRGRVSSRVFDRERRDRARGFGAFLRCGPSAAARKGKRVTLGLNAR